MSVDNSIFAGFNPFTQIYNNLVWTIDKTILIKFSPPPPVGTAGETNLLSWLLSIFFALGFIKEFIHWLKRKHGHFSIVHTFVFSWLFVMLMPTLLSSEPSVINLNIILPPIMLLSARGLWWVIEKLNKWEHLTYPRPHKHRAGLDAGPYLAMLALLLSIAILEMSRLI